MPDGVRRLHVGEVRDGLQHGLDLLIAQPDAESWFRRHDRVPGAGAVQACVQRRRLGDEEVHDGGIELGSPPLPGDLDRGVETARAVKRLDHVGERDQPGGQEDLLAPGPIRDSLAVPALERLLDTVANALGQAEPRRQVVGRGPVVVQHRRRGLAALAQERDAEPGTLRNRSAGAEVTEHEQRLGHRRREIGLAELALKRSVVAEPLRLLIRVDVASHPGNQSRVVDNLPFGLI